MYYTSKTEHYMQHFHNTTDISLTGLIKVSKWSHVSTEQYTVNANHRKNK